MTTWRFDQGRLGYFQYDEIKQIAGGLVAVDGIDKPLIGNDLLRISLAKFSSQPFAPADYTVWRNYKRVFGCQLLATEHEGKIACTELCKKIITPGIDVDDYLAHYVTRFYYPSPIFEGYDTTSKLVFPGLAILKLLVSEYLTGKKSFITIDEIKLKLIGNDVTGLEPISYYAQLGDVHTDADMRQPRELVRFISQMSFLKWSLPNLHLEVANKEEAIRILDILTPYHPPRNPDPCQEILALGAGFGGTSLGDLTLGETSPLDIEFTEGSKIRARHLRTERSSKLKEFFFLHATAPHVCDMCGMDTLQQYPWTSRLIEIHHLLPLSSPLRVETGTTSIKDVIGLCPSCHRATHKYYIKWLSDQHLKDFRNYEEALNVYEEVKKRIEL